MIRSLELELDQNNLYINLSSSISVFYFFSGLCKISIYIDDSSRMNSVILMCCSTVVWREFAWGAIAGAFGEGMLHPIDTIKTRIQSQVILSGSQVTIVY